MKLINQKISIIFVSYNYYTGPKVDLTGNSNQNIIYKCDVLFRSSLRVISII